MQGEPVHPEPAHAPFALSPHTPFALSLSKGAPRSPFDAAQDERMRGDPPRSP